MNFHLCSGPLAAAFRHVAIIRPQSFIVNSTVVALTDYVQ